MPKKYYPGGFRLTKKTAAALAVRELGTARGLEAEPGMPEGYFHITFGNLDVRIFPDASDSSHRSSSRLIQMSIDMDGGPERIARFFNPDTLEPCTGEEEVYRRAHRRDQLEEWIEREGPEMYRCGGPGPRRGYSVSVKGRFLPYVPAWCPMMETNLKK